MARRNHWLTRGMAIVLLMTSLAPTFVFAATIVREIVVEGARATASETVKSHLAFASGSTATAAAINTSIKQLFATGAYSDVRIDDDGRGRVVVRVVENPRVARVAFEGNASIESAKLAAAIKLRAGAIFTRARAHADELAIRELLLRAGRSDAAVTSSSTGAGEGKVDVIFKIVEGELHKVEAINFIGNRAFSAADLRDVIGTTASGWFDFLKGSAVFNIKEQVDLDRVLLRQYYQKHGYADAVIAAPTVERDASGGFIITFAVDEGDLYNFGPQTVATDDASLDRAALSSLITARPGDLYDASRIDASSDAIARRLAETGHPFVRVLPRSDRDVARKVVSVAYRLEAGPALYVDRIEISGNDRTRDHVVRRELRITEGDAFNTVLAEGARKRLMRTGFFKSVEIKAERTARADHVTLRVELVEQPTGDLSFGIGYSQNDGIIGDVSYVEKNIMGTGLAGKVKVEAAQRRYGAEIGLTDPRFLGSNVSAGFDVFYRDVDRSLTSSYKEQRWGGSMRLAAPITETLTGSLNYTFTRSTLYDVGVNASTVIKNAVPNYPASANSTYDTSSVGYGLAFDTRDNPRKPASGVYASVRQDFAGVGGDAQFVRSQVDVRGYTPVAAGIVLGGHLGGGYIAGYGGQDVRLLDLFYRGNDIVRGFAPAGIGPRDGASANQDALGGKMYYTSSLEARAPVPLLPSSFGLSAVGFVDAGSLFAPSKAASSLPGLTGNSAAPRISTGVGLEWDSPLGPLQASYGVALSKQAGDKTQPFNFGLGSGF